VILRAREWSLALPFGTETQEASFRTDSQFFGENTGCLIVSRNVEAISGCNQALRVLAGSRHPVLGGREPLPALTRR